LTRTAASSCSVNSCANRSRRYKTAETPSASTWTRTKTKSSSSFTKGTQHFPSQRRGRHESSKFGKRVLIRVSEAHSQEKAQDTAPSAMPAHCRKVLPALLCSLKFRRFEI